MQAGPDHETERAWLAAIVACSNDPIVAKDLQGIVSSWNDAAERLFGYTAQEMIGRPITVIFPPDRVAEEDQILGRVARGELVDRFETERLHRSGRRIPVSVTISPVKDRSGAVIGVSKIIRDLTEQTERDRQIQELQAELIHVQRLNEFGQFVSSLVHEVNQPLTATSNYLSACRRLAAAGNTAGVAAALERIDEQTQRTRQIVQRIRDFVKKRDLRMQTENLSQVIAEAIALTHASARDALLRLETRVDDSSSVQIDKVQVQQVLFNLLRNGIEAMQDQPRRDIRIEAVPTHDSMVEVSVADSGPGLPQAVRERLFQPFVTTKPNGMGVGLSVCRTIIEAHGGQLWADDAAGEGAVFRFTLRRAGDHALARTD
jgi:two-component system sensor kinase FixL